ncbi:MAG: glycosyltransferase family 39 protein [Victivallales bacterium]
MLEKLQSLFSSSRLSTATAYFAVLIVWAGIYLPGLGTLDIEFNEGRRIMPAVAMLETGNWQTPSLAGNEYFKKPPMINWLIASSFIINGERSEFAARFPSVFFVLVFVSVLVLMPSELLSLRGRLMGAILFMTAYGSIDNGRQIEIDSVYACLTGIATVCWLNLWSSGRPSRLRLWIIPALALGGGLLVKGPLILLFFYLVVLSVAISEKKTRELLRYEHFAGIALMCLIFLSWAFFINSPKTQSQQMATTWLNEIILRFNAEDVNVILWGKRVLGAVMGFLPWLVFIPFFWNKKWVSNIEDRHLKVFTACRLAFVLSFLIVNLMPGTKARYSYPLFCLALVMLGWLLSVQPAILSITEKIWKRILLTVLPLISFVSLLCLAVVVLNYFNVFSTLSPRIAEMLSPLRNLTVAFSIFVSSMIIAVYACSVVRKRGLINGYGMLVPLSGLTGVCIMLVYASSILPIVEQKISRVKSRMGKELSAQIKGNTLYAYQCECEPFLFYVRPRVEFLVNPGQIGGEVRFILSRTELQDELKKTDAICDRNPREIFKFKIRKTEYQLVELVGK